MNYGKQRVALKALIRKNWLDTEMRTQINTAKVEQYALEISDGAEFPVPVAFADPKSQILWVGDGFHRILARKENGDKTVMVDIRRGGFREAFLHCIESNKSQIGLPFGLGDKQRCIRTLLTDEVTRQWTHLRIAETVGCSCGYVTTVVSRLVSEGWERPASVVDKNGRVKPVPATRDREIVEQRRRKVFDLLHSGKTKKDIAAELGVKRSCVDQYIRRQIDNNTLTKCLKCGGSGYVEVLNGKQA